MIIAKYLTKKFCRIFLIVTSLLAMVLALIEINEVTNTAYKNNLNDFTVVLKIVITALPYDLSIVLDFIAILSIIIFHYTVCNNKYSVNLQIIGVHKYYPSLISCINIVSIMIIFILSDPLISKIRNLNTDIQNQYFKISARLIPQINSHVIIQYNDKIAFLDADQRIDRGSITDIVGNFIWIEFNQNNITQQLYSNKISLIRKTINSKNATINAIDAIILKNPNQIENISSKQYIKYVNYKKYAIDNFVPLEMVLSLQKQPRAMYLWNVIKLIIMAKKYKIDTSQYSIYLMKYINQTIAVLSSIGITTMIFTRYEDYKKLFSGVIYSSLIGTTIIILTIMINSSHFARIYVNVVISLVINILINILVYLIFIKRLKVNY